MLERNKHNSDDGYPEGHLFSKIQQGPSTITICAEHALAEVASERNGQREGRSQDYDEGLSAVFDLNGGLRVTAKGESGHL